MEKQVSQLLEMCKSILPKNEDELVWYLECEKLLLRALTDVRERGFGVVRDTHNRMLAAQEENKGDEE